MPKDTHLGLIERHRELLIDAMRILELTAEQEGMRLPVSDLSWEAFSAKNGMLEYGGFTPMAGMLGREPESCSAQVTADDPDL